MTAAHDYEDLHRLVDQLRPDQAAAVRAEVLKLVAGNDTGSEPARRRRRISFAGLLTAEPDLGERSEDILRADYDRRSA